jgi:hypothetical protein
MSYEEPVYLGYRLYWEGYSCCLDGTRVISLAAGSMLVLCSERSDW